MKKFWFVIAAMAIFILVDVLVRSLWTDAPQTSIKAPVQKTIPSATKDSSIEKTSEKSPESNQESTKPKAHKKTKIAIPKPAEKSYSIAEKTKSCINTFKTLIDKKGVGITAADISTTATVKETAKNNYGISNTLDAYFTCKAIEEQSYSYCNQAEKLLGKPLSNTRCSMSYKAILSISHFHHRKTEFSRFQALALDAPDHVAKWMVDFYKIMEKNDPNECYNFAKNPIILNICQVVTGKIKKPKSEPESISHFYMIKALMTGQKKYLEKINDPAPKFLAKAAMGVNNHCEEILVSNMDKICNRL